MHRAKTSTVEADILKALRLSPGQTGPQLAASTGMAYTSLQRPLSNMREAGEVRMEGSKIEARWFAEEAS